MLVVELGPAAKLKDEAPPPPPNENGDDVPFAAGSLAVGAAPGKLWYWPNEKPFVGIAGAAGMEGLGF